MFERFTPEAKDLVVEAQAQRAAMGDRKVRTEHLLLALLADDGASGNVLRRCGLDADRITSRLEESKDRDAPDTAERDDDLLKGLGIDVEAIRQAADQAIGRGAFDRARARRRSDGAGSDRRAVGRNSRFDSRSKEVLELSLREALRLKTKHIGPEHIGLAMLRQGDGVAYQLLSTENLDLADLRQGWEAVALGARAR